MKRSEAARFARLCAIGAVILAGISGGIYLQRKWVAHVEKRNAPPPPPQDVERQSSGLTFSKVEGTRIVYTVHASKSTDFRGQDASLLEQVEVTVFGKDGDRNDVIHTQSCRYAKTDGGIQCSGDVIMDLQSAADATRSQKQPGAPIGITHVETSAVTFENATGIAQTVQPVKFTFPNGSGKGVGAVYFTKDGRLRLIRDVELTLNANAATAKTPGKKKKENVENNVIVRGSTMMFSKEARTIVLSGPVTADSKTEELTAGELTLGMDEAFRVQTLVATPGAGANQELPEVTSKTARGTSALRAEKLTSKLSPEGWITEVLAEQNVHGTSADGSMSADTGTMEMFPRLNQAKLITLRGKVQVDSRDPKTGLTRTLKTNALKLDFAIGEDGQQSHVTHGETLERGTVEWKDTAGARSKVEAPKLAAEIGATGKAQQLTATGGVQTERELTGKPIQRGSATAGVVQMDAEGEWTRINLHGNVRVKDGDRSAESDEGLLIHDPETAVLTGKAVARDASTETHAAKITLNQSTGDILAEGKVRSTDFSTKDGVVQLAAVPANISSDRLDANSKMGRALYSGHARLWQGPSVLEADSIELLRATHVMNAVGNVRSVFQQAPSSGDTQTTVFAKTSALEKSPAAGKATLPGKITGLGKDPAPNADKQPSLWHVSSGTLTYWDDENRARLEKNVIVQSVDQKIRAPLLDLYFTRQAPASSGNTAAIAAGNTGNTGTGFGSNSVAKNAAAGPSQISRAVGKGGVEVEEGDRRATAETGVYTSADQKFVLSGGDPTIYDASEGTTKGRELTFFIADDTIIVDSGNGLRTLTKHRVQRQ